MLALARSTASGTFALLTSIEGRIMTFDSTDDAEFFASLHSVPVALVTIPDGTVGSYAACSTSAATAARYDVVRVGLPEMLDSVDDAMVLDFVAYENGDAEPEADSSVDVGPWRDEDGDLVDER